MWLCVCVYIYIYITYNRALYAYINVRWYMHALCKPLHLRCSWSGYGPAWAELLDVNIRFLEVQFYATSRSYHVTPCCLTLRHNEQQDAICVLCLITMGQLDVAGQCENGSRWQAVRTTTSVAPRNEEQQVIWLDKAKLLTCFTKGVKYMLRV